jgi:hypothetical protein
MKHAYTALFRGIASGALCAFFAMTLASCAKEQSDEQRRRDKETRAMNRLAQAGGSFEGYVELPDNQVVPAWLTIGSHVNPVSGTPTPKLEVSLRVGFFGGVTIAAEESHFDNGNCRITATFRRLNGSPLEFRGKISDGKVLEGLLDGPNSSARTLRMVRQDHPTLPTEQEWTMQVSSQTSLGNRQSVTRGALQLKRAPVETSAPAHSDLPLLPPLEGTVRWEGSAATPHQMLSVKYDPLQGAMDLVVREGSRIHIAAIGLPKENADALSLSKPSFSFGGYIFNGSNVVATLSLTTRPGMDLTSLSLRNSPPGLWTGRYTSFSGQIYRAKAIIAESTQEGINKTDIVFAKFTRFTVKLSLCNGDSENPVVDLTASSFNQLSRVARFEMPQAFGLGTPWEVWFDDTWTTLEGSGSFSLTNPEKRGALELSVWTESSPPTCAILNDQPFE